MGGLFVNEGTGAEALLLAASAGLFGSVGVGADGDLPLDCALSARAPLSTGFSLSRAARSAGLSRASLLDALLSAETRDVPALGVESPAGKGFVLWSITPVSLPVAVPSPAGVEPDGAAAEARVGKSLDAEAEDSVAVGLGCRLLKRRTYTAATEPATTMAAAVTHAAPCRDRRETAGTAFGGSTDVASLTAGVEKLPTEVLRALVGASLNGNPSS